MKRIKNKYIRITISLIILIIGFFIGYKYYYLFKYPISSKSIENYETYKEFLKSEEKVTIEKSSSNNMEYLEFNNIKIRNDWADTLELIEDTEFSRKYVSKDTEGNIEFSILIGGSEENIIDAFIKNSKEADNGNYKKYYEENNVNDLISLLKYLIKNKDRKLNIFSSVREIEWTYTMNVLPGAIFNEASNLKFIEGDYEGIMYEYIDQNRKSVILMKDGMSYGLEFSGLDYFKDEYIIELLGTVIIN